MGVGIENLHNQRDVFVVRSGSFKRLSKVPVRVYKFTIILILAESIYIHFILIRFSYLVVISQQNFKKRTKRLTASLINSK